jgi:ABC-type Mn2+/Zn2+ transport system ATPase subunit
MFSRKDRIMQNVPQISEQTPAFLEMIDVSAGYNGKLALTDLSFKIPHGAQVAIVGPNGAGKSTLFRLLVGLLPLRGGQILIHGQPLGYHKQCVAYVPQREEVDWRFPVTVSDVVMMGRFGHQGWLDRPSAADREIVKHSMALMGIGQLAGRSISDLSGGQQQRVFLARALAQEPHILLMDEPFTGVDNPTQETTLNLLEQLKEQDVTVLVSTHDLNMASQRFEKIMLINRHLIAFGDPGEVLTPLHIKAAFGSQTLILDGAILVDECCPGEQI